MGKKNVFISHRWDYEEDYEKISAVLDRSKYDVSDRSIESSDPLVGTKKQVTDAIKGKIDSASVILAPARPAAVTAGSMGRAEINYAISKGKKIIAVNTGTTTSVASFWEDNDIEVIACRKDSLENAIG
ncbi:MULTISPECIES: hypothetical protein [unclassified Dehalobacter]|uniref:hypothetical protein n=1 Tax=unclassified Dehalobacter TaxID=2635733 RepID=UPI00059C3B50|nr:MULTISPECIES: hypothetical protein [unclassified Dehalobacter]